MDPDLARINTIRFLSVDAVQKANSGHPGLPLGAAPMAYVLWTRFLRHNPRNPAWFDRDRFAFSAGHGSMLLYSLLHLTGYDVSLDDLRAFRQYESNTPGHPERGLTPGVEVTSGPLGQGFANGVGMAMAEAHLAARFNRPGHDIIDHYTYGLVSDGDIMEGVAQEAASLAGDMRLGKLIYLYDDNETTLAGKTSLVFNEDRRKRFEAYGWHVEQVADGNDVAAIERAIIAARAEKGRPSLIAVRTHIGYGSPNKQDTYEAHGSPLGPDEVKLTKENLGWPAESAFAIPDDVRDFFRQAVIAGRKTEDGWRERFDAYAKAYPDLVAELRTMIEGDLPDGWDADIPAFPADAKGIATRVSAGKVMNAIAKRLPAIIGGSADLNPSTYTMLADMGDFQPPDRPRGGPETGAVGGVWSYAGRNIAYGVREHAMAAATSGIAAHGGLIPYCATFFAFSDYMRPAIRLAAIMGLPVKLVFTHDSIGLGEDGTTHQPIEQLASLRAIPGITVIRPCDANETAVAWKVAIETRDRPVVLVLTRQNVPTLDRTKFASAEGVRRGAYVISDVKGSEPDLVIIATGSEVHPAIGAQVELAERGIAARVVSMPSWDLFAAQPREYRDEVLPPSLKARLAVEAGATFGWSLWVGDEGGVVGLDRFGISAPGKDLMEKLGFTATAIADRAAALLVRVARA